VERKQWDEKGAKEKGAVLNSPGGIKEKKVNPGQTRERKN